MTPAFDLLCLAAVALDVLGMGLSKAEFGVLGRFADTLEGVLGL